MYKITNLNGLLDISLLILGVHRHELEDHQVERGGNDRQAEHDEEQSKGDVLRLVLQWVVLLEGHKVPEADGGQCDEAVVDGVEIRPTCFKEKLGKYLIHSLVLIFGSYKHRYIFARKNVKNQPSSAGIPTHDLLNMSFFPLPVDEGSLLLLFAIITAIECIDLLKAMFHKFIPLWKCNNFSNWHWML